MANEQPDPSAPYAEDIEVFSRIEHVRRRPDMYIGGVDSRGLHWMVFRVGGQCARGGRRRLRAASLQVALYADGSVEVADGGRGANPAFLEAALTQVLMGEHSGRDWVPYAIANALSESADRRDTA